VTAAAERFQRLLAAKISPARAADTARAILSAPGFETAEGLLVAEIEADAPEIAAEPAPVADAAGDPALAVIARPAPASMPVAAPAAEPNPQRRRRDADLEAKARQGELPPPPDFSAPTHARFRSKLDGLVALAKRGDAEALRAVTISPVSSSPKALARYRDLCIAAIEARKKA
jgi:hypothetical protein